MVHQVKEHASTLRTTRWETRNDSWTVLWPHNHQGACAHTCAYTLNKCKFKIFKTTNQKLFHGCFCSQNAGKCTPSECLSSAPQQGNWVAMGAQTHPASSPALGVQACTTPNPGCFYPGTGEETLALRLQSCLPAYPPPPPRGLLPIMLFSPTVL